MEFKQRLEKALMSPQGREINKRTQRISDRYKGGYLINKKQQVTTDDVSVLDFLEMSDEETESLQRLTPKLPPKNLKEEKPIDDTKNAIEMKNERMFCREPTTAQRKGLLQADEARMRAFKGEFDEALEKEDYFTAFMIFMAAVFVVIYVFLIDVFTEVIYLARELRWPLGGITSRSDV